jgi:hypothetical protein
MASGSTAMLRRVAELRPLEFTCSCQTSAKHFEDALNFCCPAIAAVVRSGPPLPPAPPCNRQRLFFVAGDRQNFGLSRQRTIHPQVDGQSVIMLLSPHAIRTKK